jgi:hypothetical protein
VGQPDFFKRTHYPVGYWGEPDNVDGQASGKPIAGLAEYIGTCDCLCELSALCGDSL